jgi:hypothetical protein
MNDFDRAKIREQVLGKDRFNPETTLMTLPEPVEGYDQIDWTVHVNRPMMEIVGDIETPFLMMNPGFPSTGVEKFFPFLKDTGKGLKMIAKRAGSDPVRRELVVNQMYLEDDIDWGLVEAASDYIPMDKITRMYVLTLGRNLIPGYLRNNPDNIEKFDGELGDRIVRTLLFDENFFGDSNDTDDIIEHKKKMIDVERIERSLIDEYRPRFKLSSIENLAKSQIASIRADLACVKGVSEEVMLQLAKDKIDAVRKKVVKCTKSCKALETVLDDKKTKDATREAASSRLGALCK